MFILNVSKYFVVRRNVQTELTKVFYKYSCKEFFFFYVIGSDVTKALYFGQ